MSKIRLSTIRKKKQKYNVTLFLTRFMPGLYVINIYFFFFQILPFLSQGVEGVQGLIQKSAAASASRDNTSQAPIDPDFFSTGDTPTGKKKKVRKT